MKFSFQAICQSSPRSLGRGFPLFLVLVTLVLTANESSARGFVAYRGGGGRGFVAAGGGYRGGFAYRGYGYGGVRVGAVGVRPGGFIRAIPPGYRMMWYGGYNCYYVGGVYYRPEFYQGSTVYIVVP
jgi:hypothetical protein